LTIVTLCTLEGIRKIGGISYIVEEEKSRVDEARDAQDEEIIVRSS